MSCNQFLAPNGEPSLLYAQLEEKFGTDKAVQLWNWSKGQKGEKDVNGELTMNALEAAIPEVKITAQSMSQDPKPKHRIAMNFKDGDGGRKMRPEFAGKSTMDLILSGNRTATSRDWSKPSNRVDVQPGDIIEFYGDGKTVLVEATTGWYPLDMTAEQWSKVEGWAPDRFEILKKKGYVQFQYKLYEAKKVEETIGPSVDVPLTSFEFGSVEKFTNSIAKLYDTARQNPSQLYILPFAGNMRIGSKYYTPLQIANMLDKTNPPANIGFDPKIVRLFQNIPRNFITMHQSAPESLEIAPAAIQKQMDVFFVRMRNEQKELTDQWFSYDVQKDVLDVILYRFFEIFQALNTNKDMQAEMKRLDKPVMEYVRDKILQQLDQYRQNWTAGANALLNPSSATEFEKKVLERIPAEMKDKAPVMAGYFTQIVNAFDGSENSFWEFAKQRMKALGIKPRNNPFEDDETSAVRNDDGQIEFSEGEGLKDYSDDAFMKDMKDTASSRIKLFLATTPETSFREETKPKSINLIIHSDDTKERIKVGLKKDLVLKAGFAQANNVTPADELRAGDLNPREKTQRVFTTGLTTKDGINDYRLKAVRRLSDADLTDEFVARIEQEEGFTPKAGDVIASVEPYVAEQNIMQSSLNSLQQNRLADYEMLFQDLTGLLADRQPSWEGYTRAMRESGNANILRTLQRLEKAPDHVKKEFVAVFSSHYQKLTLVLLKRERGGMLDTRIIDSNRNSELQTLIRLWQEAQKETDLLIDSPEGKMINPAVAEGLYRELQEIYKFTPYVPLTGEQLRAKYGSKWKDYQAQELEKHERSRIDHNNHRTEFFNRVLKMNGITLSPEALNDLWDNIHTWGQKYQISSIYAGFTVDKGEPIGLIDRLVWSLYSGSEEALEEEQERLFKVNNPLYTENKAVPLLARVQLKYTPQIYSQTARNSEGKNIYNFGLNTSLSHSIRLLKEDESYRNQFLNAHFSKHSWLLARMINNTADRNLMQLTYLDGLKNEFGSRDGVTRPLMSNREQWLTALGLFINKGNRKMHMLSLTHSDKTRTPLFSNVPRITNIIRQGGIGEDGRGGHSYVSAGAVSVVYKHTFRAEFERITAPGGEEIEGYANGKKYFYLLPKFNYAEMQKLMMKGKITTGEFTQIWNEKKELQPEGGKEWMDTVRRLIDLQLTEMVDETITSLENSGLFEEMIPGNTAYYMKRMTQAGYRFMGQNDDRTPIYEDPAGEVISQQEYKELQKILLAADYTVNSFVFNSSLSQVFYGDPALFFKGTVTKTIAQYGKRLAKDVAPGRDGDFAHSPEYIAVTIKDWEPAATELRGLPGYDKVNATDAQELTTVREHLDVLWAYGKISKQMYEQAVGIINNANGGFYTFKDIPELEELIMQPMKPVYARLAAPVDGVMRYDYIKSSSFPLYPPVIAGMQLDKLRKAMEKPATGSPIARVNFISAKKTGAPASIPQIFKPAGQIDETIFTSETWMGAHQSLPREGFRLQQEVPYDEEKDSILTVSQMNKLVTALITNMTGTFNYRGEELTGKQMRQLKEDLRKQLINLQHSKLLQKVGAELSSDGLGIVFSDKKKFYDLLGREAREREGYTINDIMALTTTTEDGKLMVPLMFAPSAAKFEGLAMSLIKKVVQIKMPGRSFVQGSPAGFQFWEDSTLNNNEIVWTSSNYTGGPLKTAHIDDEGKVQPAQILVGFNYFLKNGERINIADYIKPGLSAETQAKLSMIENVKQKLLNETTVRFTSKEDPVDYLKVGDRYFRLVEAQDLTEIEETEFVEITQSGEFDITTTEEKDKFVRNYLKIYELDSIANNPLLSSEDKKLAYKDLQNYSGKKMLDTERIPRELLQMLGARIPNQGFSSMLPIEIVGFLPETMGDIVIVPAAITKQMGADFDVDKLYTYHRAYRKSGKKLIPITDNYIEKLGANEEEYRELEAATIALLQQENVRPDRKGRYAEFKEYLGRIVDQKYPDGNVPKHQVITNENSELNLKNQYFDVQWSILMDPKIFPLMIQPLDKKDLANEVEEVGDTNISQYYFSPGYQLKDFQSMKGAKTLVGLTSLALTSNAVVEDKNVRLGMRNEDGEVVDTYISIHDDEGKVIKLSHISGYGESYYNGEKRSKADNIQIQQSESVDHANNRVIDKLNLNPVTALASLAMSRLQSEDTSDGDTLIPGQALSLDYNARMLVQPIILRFTELMAKGNDTLSSMFNANLAERVYEDLRNEYINEGGSSIGMKISPKTLQETLGMKPASVEFLSRQIDILDKFIEFYRIGQQIGTMQQITSQDTNGAGADMLSVLDVIDKKANMVSSTNAEEVFITGVGDLYTGTETGVIYNNTVSTAVDLLSDDLPYKLMQPFFNNIREESGKTDQLSITQKQKLMRGLKSYLFSNSTLGLTRNAYLERQRLLFGTQGNGSLAERIKEAKETWGEYNYFIKRLNVTIDPDGLDPDVVEYYAAKATMEDDFENSRAWLDMFNNPDRKELAEDLLRYVMVTGGVQNARNFVKYIPWAVMEGTSIGQALFQLVESDENNNTQLEIISESKILKEQIYQHHPEMARQLSEKLEETGRTYEVAPDVFYLPDINFDLIENPAKALEQVYTMPDGSRVTRYPDYLSHRNKFTNTWTLYKKMGYDRDKGYQYAPIDLLGDRTTGIVEYSFGQSETRSVFPENRTTVLLPDINISAEMLTVNAKPQNLRAIEQIGITSNIGGEAEVIKALQVIALDKQQPNHLRVVAATLAEMGDNPAEAITRQRLGINNDITLEVKESMDSLTAGGQYTAGPSLLEINAATAVSKVSVAETLVHEMMHRHTILTLGFMEPESVWSKSFVNPTPDQLNYVRRVSDALRADEELKNKVAAITKLRKELLARLEAAISANYGQAYLTAAKNKNEYTQFEHKLLLYAFGNNEEFVAHAMTNSTVMAWMNNQKYEGTTVIERLKELLSQFWGALTTFMNINKGSALEEAVKLTLDLLMHQQAYKGQFARMNMENFSVVANSLANTATTKAIDPISKIIGKLEEERWMLIATQPSIKDRLAKARRRREIDQLKEQIEELKKQQDLARIPAIAQAQLDWVASVVANPMPTPIDLNTAQKIADMWQGVAQILFGNAQLQAGNEIGEISKRAMALSAQILEKSKQVLSAKLELTGDDLDDRNIQDVSSGEMYTRSLLAASTSKATARIAQFATDMARQEDEQVYRELEELKTMEETMRIGAEERGMKLPELYELFTDTDKGNWGRTMQYSGTWFQTRHELIRKRNGKIKGIESKTDLDELEKKARKAAVWKNFNDEMNKISVGVNTNKFFEPETGEFKADITVARKELADAVGEEHVQTVLERAQRRYLLYLEHRQDMFLLIESELLAGLAIATTEEEKNKLHQKAAEAKADFQNRHSPNVFFSDSTAKSLSSASEKYTTYAPRADAKDMWSSKYKRIIQDHQNTEKLRAEGKEVTPSLLELYEDYYNKIDELVGYLPATEQNMASRDFLPIVPKNQVEGTAFNFRTWLEGTQERFVRSIGANAYEEFMNKRLYNKIPVEYIEESVDHADRSKDLIGSAKLFAMMATHYRYASASKDVVELGETILKEVHKSRIEGNSQMVDDRGVVVTMKDGIENTLRGIEYLKDYLIFRKPRKLEVNLSGKLYAERTAAGKEFSIAPWKQKKISDKITALILERKKYEKQYDDGDIDEETYLKLSSDIDVELSKYEGFTIYGSKLGDKLIGINQLKQLSYNPFSAVANLGFGILSGFIHGSGGLDYTTAEFMAAFKLMMKARTDKELSMKLHKIMDRLGVIGDYIDTRYGKQLELRDDKSKLRKALEPFAMMRSTDFMMKGATTLAMLMHEKVKVMIDGAEKEVSVLEAHDSTGKWNTEEYGDSPEWYSKDTAEQVKWNRLKSKIIRINTIIHGNTDKNSPKLANKYILGRLLGQFRMSWLPEGWFNRFGSERYDEELERTIKGRYRTMGSLGWGGSALVLARQALNVIPGVNVDPFKGRILKKGDDRSLLSDSVVDMDNMRRNFSELGFYMTLAAAILMLKLIKGGMDDEEDRKSRIANAAMQTLINMLIRSKQDIKLYASPGVFNAVMRNPIPAADVIIDYFKLVGATQKLILDDDYEFNQWLLKFTRAGLPIPQATQVNKWNYMISRNLDEFE